MTEAIKPFTCSISDRRIGITLFILELIKDIFHVPQNISTVVGITLSVNSYEYIIYLWLIFIDLLISTKLLFCRGGGIKSEVRGGRRDESY